jgi:Protein of unknown function (DUF3027)
MSDTYEQSHERWMRRLRQTWPEGVPAREPEPGERRAPRDVEPWPETWRDSEGAAMQCLHCRYYVELSGEFGADWGACICGPSQYDGQLVFEHWTCRHWESEKREQ